MARATLGIVDGGLDPQPLPEPGFVRLRAVNFDKLGLVAELNGPVVPSGYGKFDVTARPGDVGITSYSGREPLTLPLPLLLDRWTDRGTIEPEIRMLERMLGLDPEISQPPALIVEGFGVPHSYSRAPQNRYVLSGDPTWGEIRTRPGATDGHKSYAEVTVTARLLSRPEALSSIVKAGGRSTFTVPATGTPRTLRGIAKRKHADWRKLRQLNPRLPGDPDKALPAGTKVRIS